MLSQNTRVRWRRSERGSERGVKLYVLHHVTRCCAVGALQGHYLKMQNYLREQPGVTKNHDIISQTCALFENIVRHIRPAILAVAVKGKCDGSART